MLGLGNCVQIVCTSCWGVVWARDNRAIAHGPVRAVNMDVKLQHNAPSGTLVNQTWQTYCTSCKGEKYSLGWYLLITLCHSLECSQATLQGCGLYKSLCLNSFGILCLPSLITRLLSSFLFKKQLGFKAKSPPTCFSTGKLGGSGIGVYDNQFSLTSYIMVCYLVSSFFLLFGVPMCQCTINTILPPQLMYLLSNPHVRGYWYP